MFDAERVSNIQQFANNGIRYRWFGSSQFAIRMQKITIYRAQNGPTKLQIDFLVSPRSFLLVAATRRHPWIIGSHGLLFIRISAPFA
jgi:hypothetical protein